MNKLILCEGKTDAILLSYYLEKTCGWAHGAKAPKGLDITVGDTGGGSAYWYDRDDDKLLICGVGGKSNFSNFFKAKILPAMIDSSAFSKIAIVTDRDNRAEVSILSSVKSTFRKVISNISPGIWQNNTYQNSYDQTVFVDFLLLIIPTDKEGALETLLLDAISENEYDRVIVEKSKGYIEKIAKYADKYIGKPRLRLKAWLGVTWAIRYPEKIFDLIDAQIRSVNWQDSQILNECFYELKKI
jgi:hypothetical protein